MPSNSSRKLSSPRGHGRPSVSLATTRNSAASPAVSSVGTSIATVVGANVTSGTTVWLYGDPEMGCPSTVTSRV
eukprot:1186508-Prorocentrum_minimum.AAC.4